MRIDPTTNRTMSGATSPSYLTTHSTHFILRLYGVIKYHLASERGKPLPPLHTSCGALPRTRNCLMGPPCKIDPITHRTMTGRSATELHDKTTTKKTHKTNERVSNTFIPHHYITINNSVTFSLVQQGRILRGGGGGGGQRKQFPPPRDFQIKKRNVQKIVPLIGF